MLSKLFNSARNIFNATPQIELTNEPSNEPIYTEMVTTRGQRGKHAEVGISGERAIEVDVPRSSRKRPRYTELEESVATDNDEEVVATSAKKQKALPLREKDEEGPKKNTGLMVEIPVSRLSVNLHGLREEVERSDLEAEEEEEEDEENGENQPTDAAQLEISDSESDDGSEAPEELAKPNSVFSKKQDKLTNSPRKFETTRVLPRPTHKHFGSEEPEPEPEFFSTAMEVIQSDEESGDDDTPEVVGAQDALESAKSKARDAAKAVEVQETAIRKKHQERDAKLKKQAEIASKKRKRAPDAEEEVGKASKDTDVDGDEGKELNLSAGKGRPVENMITPMSISRSNLPDLLPEEYLEDDDDPEPLPTQEMEVARIKPKKIKFADLVEKKPKDRRKGSTTYRVSEVRSKHLAPKSSVHAKAMKESWMKGRISNGFGGGRKVASGGFFKKK